MKTGTNLFITFLFLNLLIAGCDCGKTPPPDGPKDTQAPVVAIQVSSLTTTSASFTFSATDNVGVTSLVLSVSGTQQNVLGQSSATVSGLTANTDYTAYLSAKDAAGNTGNAQVSFKTTARPSTWFGTPTITGASPISGMIGNTISNSFTITLSNTSGVAKTATFSLDFGNFYIKMLRYQAANAPDGTGWTALPANSGKVTFSNFSLPAGSTSLKAVFASKPSVAHGSAINLSFTSLDDGEGGGVAASGWQAPVSFGTMDGSTAPTQLVTEWWGYSSSGPLYLGPNGVGSISNYNVTNVKVSGPAPAKVASLKLYNPYGNALIWEGNWRATSFNYVAQITASWNNDFVNLNFDNSATISNNAMEGFIIWCNLRNASSTVAFNSGYITPGIFGLVLKTKYDLVIQNSSGQVIDISDAVIKQESTPLSN